jgi:glycosyltransferase involved in cell wall biosynthesis
MNILLLSAYDAPSHKRWRQGLVSELNEHSWTSVTLPPRYFSWRVRGNSLIWSQDPLLRRPYDLIVTTSMTDLSALRGLVPQLCKIPTLVYFHENQFAYPQSERQLDSLEPAVLNLYSAMAADCIVFNSSHNLDSFQRGVETFLHRMPDHVPRGISEQLSQKAVVVPVPLEANCYFETTKSEHFTLLWNHRWEYDKGPDRLLDICKRLLSKKLEFRLHLLGQKFRQQPDSMNELVKLLEANNCLGRVGYIEDISDYQGVIGESHVVLSTAIHEFQGLSVLEGIAAGCVPVVPDRLAYPEFVPEQFRYRSEKLNASEVEYQLEIDSAVDRIVHMAEHREDLLAPDVKYLSWRELAEDYRGLLNSLVR